jgi:rhodanese-related sulfurtransferase
LATRRQARQPLGIHVRTPHERDQKYIAGSLSIPLNHPKENLEKLPKDRALLVCCAGGYRSSLAASLLQGSGFACVSEIAGGITAWEAASLPVQISPSSVIEFRARPKCFPQAARAFKLFYRHHILTENDPSKKTSLLQLSRLNKVHLVAALVLLGAEFSERM